MSNDKTVYVVIVPKVYTDDYSEIPYSFNREVALNYCDKLGLVDDCVKSMPIEVFNKLKIGSEKAGEFTFPAEIHIYEIGDSEYPLTEDDYNNASSEVDNDCITMLKDLFSLYDKLKFIELDEAKEVRKAIKRLIKVLGGCVGKKNKSKNVSLELAEHMNFEKYLNHFLKLKGVSYI